MALDSYLKKKKITINNDPWELKCMFPYNIRNIKR